MNEEREKKVHKPNLFRQATAGEHQMIYYLFIEITILPKKKHSLSLKFMHLILIHACKGSKIASVNVDILAFRACCIMF